MPEAPDGVRHADLVFRKAADIQRLEPEDAG